MARCKYPEVGHVFRLCLICGKPFRVYKYRLTRRGNGRFCTTQCLFAAWHLFSEALAMGLLEHIFQKLAAALEEQDQKTVEIPHE
jgi:hypothetical protein